MGCQHLDDLYELYLLSAGGPPDDETAEIAEHAARGCAYCLERLREATQVVYLLVHARHARPVRPGPKLRAELLRRLRKMKASDAAG